MLKYFNVLFLFLTPFNLYLEAQSLYLEKLILPPGFTIRVFTSNTPNARSMATGDSGTLFVGTRTEGKVYALRDTNNDFQADQVITIAHGNYPNGVAFLNGSLYVAHIDRILRYDSIETKLTNPPKPIIVKGDFPTETHHGWKFIRFSPDSLLYVPVGAPCNICLSKDPLFASITRMRPDGSGFELFASGIRNTVGFDWHPETGNLWFTENGGDNLGDDIPPDELNTAPRKGMHFGFPHCHGGMIKDKKYNQNKSCDQFTPPAMKLQAHTAALGMRFYTGDMFPESYRNAAFICEHGSWNRSTKVGYRITVVTFDKGQPVSYKTFAEGWLQGDSVWGRPVDVELMKDGSMLVSDDYAGVIYRISYKKSP